MNKGYERNTNLNEGKRVLSKEFRNGDDDGDIKSNRGRNSRTLWMEQPTPGAAAKLATFRD